MQKYIGLILGGLMMTTPALADTVWEKCNSNNGGTLVTVAGQTFCKSNSTMNWWSAYAWCEAIDGYIPSIMELCPNAPNGLTESAACGVNYGDKIWSATPKLAGSQFMWFASGTNISNNAGRADRGCRVFCLKK